MPRLMFLAVLTVVVAILSGCGGVIDDLRTARDSRDVARRVDALPGTAYRAVPTSGRAAFDGNAFLLVATPGGPTRLIGDARLVLDFGRGTVRGEAGDFFEAARSNRAAVSGAIRFGTRGSRIGAATGAPNTFTTSTTGTLTIVGRPYRVGGSVDGRMVGTRIDPAGGRSAVKGLTISDVTVATGPTGRRRPLGLAVRALNR